MSNAQSLLDQMRRRPAEHTTNMNTSRDCDAPVENHTTNQVSIVNTLNITCITSGNRTPKVRPKGARLREVLLYFVARD